MRIAVTGGSGLIGTAIRSELEKQGHQVTNLTRKGSDRGEEEKVLLWEPERGEIDAGGLEGMDAVIHLAGENISARRWTSKQKERIRESRIRGTTLLCETLARLRQKPKVLLSASAFGYYGNRDSSETLDESAAPGEGFLARVTEEWERSTRAAEEAGIRTVHMRFGMVLSREGGALAKMLPMFKLGGGGRIGDGNQMMSWISLEEIPRIVSFLLQREELSGPVNIVTPHPVSNAVFTRTLGQVLRRPAVIPLPAFAARLFLGEMAEELLLSGSRTLPCRLMEAGYTFSYPELPSALRGILGETEEK
ncbi:TIGR01777 family oxidoreductase [Paludifilum halophilum]|uniref:TIGR01777 family protein n=1 Tax=Paludifilum halophilum TaxID=1642702 RepID=A0A235B6P7_9BACL|nr:TIGR01777 family oxidoreductase [Paludifilum halophilum]OYD07285.1 TIGR01777 family protein [Paludifilum halophilum]